MERPEAMRFDPPPLQLEEDTIWILRRAFAAPGLETASPPDPGAAVARAGALGVAARIAHRAAPASLRRELGADRAAQLSSQVRKALEGTLAYEALAATLARHAAARGHPAVFLKGYALHAAGHAAPGSRPVGDLDLLVPEADASSFHEGLLRQGFRAAAGRANEQHLPPLAAPGWGVVDVHYALRGVCDPSGRWLDAVRVVESPGSVAVLPGAWVPAPALLAAHALAHAIEQHGVNPHPYPLLRLVADLQDLLPDDAAWEAALPDLSRWLEPTLSPAEIEGSRELTQTLAAGNLPVDPAGPAGRLLAHFLAHALSPEYRSSLRKDHLRHRLGQARRRGTLLGYAGRKFLDLWRRVVRTR